MKKKSPAIIFTVLVLAVAAIGIGIGAYLGEKDPDVNMIGGNLVIDCVFGTTVPVSDIRSITLLDKSMAEIDDSPGERTNGYGGAGNTQRGEFSSEQLGPHRRYVYATASPTILVDCKSGGDVYISCRDASKTLEIFGRLTLE